MEEQNHGAQVVAPTHRVIADLVQRKTFSLVVSLLLLLALYPFLEQPGRPSLTLDLLQITVLLSGIYAVSNRKRHIVIGLLLALPMPVNEAIGYLLPEYRFHRPAMLLPLAFYGFTILVLLKHVMSDTVDTLDRILGAISVYLLLGIAWAAVYTFLEILIPGSFYADASHLPAGHLRWSEFLYFSFATLTTLGYGDITPVNSYGRSLSLLEAVTGVLYIAIMIARLVSLYQPESERD